MGYRGVPLWNACSRVSVERQIEGKNVGKNMTGRLAACALGIALGACGGEKKAEPPSTVTAVDTPKGSAKSSVDAPPRRAQITAKSLSPVVIHEIGEDSVVPTAI